MRGAFLERARPRWSDSTPGGCPERGARLLGCPVPRVRSASAVQGARTHAPTPVAQVCTKGDFDGLVLVKELDVAVLATAASAVAKLKDEAAVKTLLLELRAPTSVTNAIVARLATVQPFVTTSGAAARRPPGPAFVPREWTPAACTACCRLAR